jgi:hypothetical protein
VLIGDEVYSGCRSTDVKTCMFFSGAVECVVEWWEVQGDGNLVLVILLLTSKFWYIVKGRECRGVPSAISLSPSHKVFVKLIVATPSGRDGSERTRHIDAIGPRLVAVGCSIPSDFDSSCRLTWKDG